MVRYCTLHGIGYNPQLDPTCPQCALARMAPAEALDVDLNPESTGYGRPKPRGKDVGDAKLPKVL